MACWAWQLTWGSAVEANSDKLAVRCSGEKGRNHLSPDASGLRRGIATGGAEDIRLAEHDRPQADTRADSRLPLRVDGSGSSSRPSCGLTTRSTASALPRRLAGQLDVLPAIVRSKVARSTAEHLDRKPSSAGGRNWSNPEV